MIVVQYSTKTIQVLLINMELKYLCTLLIAFFLGDVNYGKLFNGDDDSKQ
jgi:hypothetical protein